MGKTREIKRRMKAVGNIRRITKTMQMIATSKFARAQQRAVASKPYTNALFDLVGKLASAAGEVSHPLIDTKPGAGARPLTLVLTSDRGLCGPYNGAILRKMMEYFRATPESRDGLIELVGKKGLATLKFNKITVATHHTHFGDKPSYEDVEKLAQVYIDRFIAGEISGVKVIYMKFISTSKQTTEVKQLLPFVAEQAPTATQGEKKESAQPFEFSPSPRELMDDLLPAALKAALFQCFNDAIVSEHVARMVAMKAATDNAGKMGKRLSRAYNRARQAQITTELTEIISGAAALG
jgi:F-type H+-transporting ATPase subunit gamma